MVRGGARHYGLPRTGPDEVGRYWTDEAAWDGQEGIGRTAPDGTGRRRVGSGRAGPDGIPYPLSPFPLPDPANPKALRLSSFPTTMTPPHFQGRDGAIRRGPSRPPPEEAR